MKAARIAAELALAGGFLIVLAGVALLLIAVGAIASLRRRPPAPPPEPDELDSSVIVLNWNGKDLLAECLPSLVRSVESTPGRHELILVDNASTDDSIRFVRESFPSIRVVPMARNDGFCAGCNAGAAIARGKYLVMMNNDMLVAPSFLGTLLAGFQHPDVFAVTAQILFADPRKRREETGKTRGVFSAGRFCVAHDLPGPDEPPIQPVFYAGGGSSAFDRAKFRALGGFDVLFRPFYVDDADISYRAWKRGWASVLCVDAVVHHKHRATIGRAFDPRWVEDVIASNTTLFVWKNARDPRILLANVASFVGEYVAEVVHGNGNARPIRLALRRLPETLRRIWQDRRFERFTDAQTVALTHDRIEFRERFVTPRSVAPGEPRDILFLSPYAPYPPAHGGAVRMYNVMTRLGRRHRVRLLTYVDTPEEAEAVHHLDQFCTRVTAIVRRPDTSRYNPFGADPLCRVEFDTPPFRTRFLEELARPTDVLQIDYTELAHFVRPSRHYVTVLTEHDVSFLSHFRRFQQAASWWAKVRDGVAWLKMLSHELAWCRRFDLLLTVTEREEHYLRSYLPSVAISSAAPTGVDVAHYQPRDLRAVEPNTLLFVGYLRHTPNVEAARYLAEQVLPRLRSRLPTVRLTIVGAEPPPQISRLARDPAISVTGFVEDVRPYYRTHAVFVAPILSGAGVRVKILEAMAAGIPVVTTTLGAEGIRCDGGRDLVVADDPATFAEAVAELLTDPDRAATLSRNAREVVEAHYDWDVIVANLEHLYDEQLARKRGPARSPDAVDGVVAAGGHSLGSARRGLS